MQALFGGGGSSSAVQGGGGGDNQGGGGGDNTGGGDEPPAKRAKRTKGDAASKIDSSASFLFQIPLCRLQGIIETLHPDFDVIATDCLDRDQCLKLIWVLSGVKGNLAVSSVRNMTYEDFYNKNRRRCKPAQGRARELKQ